MGELGVCITCVHNEKKYSYPKNSNCRIIILNLIWQSKSARYLSAVANHHYLYTIWPIVKRNNAEILASFCVCVCVVLFGQLLLLVLYMLYPCFILDITAALAAAAIAFFFSSLFFTGTTEITWNTLERSSHYKLSSFELRTVFHIYYCFTKICDSVRLLFVHFQPNYFLSALELLCFFSFSFVQREIPERKVQKWFIDWYAIITKAAEMTVSLVFY